MSLYYEHFLIPESSTLRPDASAVASFLEAILERGYVAAAASIEVARVLRIEQRATQFPNPFSGREMAIYGPSRKTEKPVRVSSLNELTSMSEREPEYEAFLRADGMPPSPVCQVGCLDSGEWRPFNLSYHHEVICHVRDSAVRLSAIRSEDDLKPPKGEVSEYRPYFGEDCDVDECDGLFVHPDLGAFRIADAGCATFWISFRFGKMLYPKSTEGGVAVLDKNVIGLATASFRTDFIQACHWG
jgi:hypothetical protein